MATASPEIINLSSPKRNPSPIRHFSSSKRVKCSKDQMFEDPNSEPDLKKKCHQCRQCPKKSDFNVASCKNLKKKKICGISYCSKCLFNRYGEKAEEVNLLSDWKCPKCCDICNCSSCRKNKGKLPTGILVHTAKATGFTSVYDMLIGKGKKSLSSTNVLKDVNSSPKKQVADKDSPVVISEKDGKENSFADCIKNVLGSHKSGKENELAGENDSDFAVISRGSLFGARKVRNGKRKDIENVGSIGNASQGKVVSQMKNTVAKKSKILKEKKSNSNKGGSIIIELEGPKNACSAKDNSQFSIKEEGSKSETSKHTDPEVVILKDTLKEHIKINGKANEIIRPACDKKIHGNGNNDHDQAQHSPTLLSIKKNMFKKMEKTDARVLPGIEACKNSTTFNNNKQGTFEKENKNADSQMLNFEIVSPECVHKDVIAEENNSLLGVDDIMPNSVYDGGDRIVSDMKPAISALRDPKKHASIDVIPLPHGSDLTIVAGIDIPAEDVGHALQFLEFCSAFGQFFHLTKGQSELILRELVHGCSRRISSRRSSSRNTRTQYSSVVQLHIQLLSLLLKDSGEGSHTLSPTDSGNSWLQALGKCISESKCRFDDLPLDCLNKDSSAYSMLDSSKKLRLLNFLCDEALCTADLRTWIDEKNSKIIEKEKEARQKVTTAKDKEKQAKQQLQDEIEKANANGSPLSLLERDELVAKMKKETEIAHAEMQDALKKIPQTKQRSDAVRTDSVLFDGNGHVFWRLRCYSGQPDILVQDIGSMDSGNVEEKWSTYVVEQKGMVERYISLSGKKVKLQRTPKLPTLDCEL